MRDVMLTTVDNPYDPFENFDEWYAYDVDQGYFTCAYLARIAHTSNEVENFDDDSSIEDAIDEILSMNVLGIYRKVEKNFDETN